MALFLFTKAMLLGKPINVFNNGDMIRDFTYIDDVVEGMIRVLDKPATASPAFDPVMPDPATSNVTYRVFNIGNGAPTPLMEYIQALEAALGVTAKMTMPLMQPGDVVATGPTPASWALGRFQARYAGARGVKRFVDWYLGQYGRRTS